MHPSLRPEFKDFAHDDGPQFAGERVYTLPRAKARHGVSLLYFKAKGFKLRPTRVDGDVGYSIHGTCAIVEKACGLYGALRNRGVCI